MLSVEVYFIAITQCSLFPEKSQYYPVNYLSVKAPNAKRILSYNLLSKYLDLLTITFCLNS